MCASGPRHSARLMHTRHVCQTYMRVHLWRCWRRRCFSGVAVDVVALFVRRLSSSVVANVDNKFHVHVAPAFAVVTIFFVVDFPAVAGAVAVMRSANGSSQQCHLRVCGFLCGFVAGRHHTSTAQHNSFGSGLFGSSNFAVDRTCRLCLRLCMCLLCDAIRWKHKISITTSYTMCAFVREDFIVCASTNVCGLVVADLSTWVL